ncbi:MAG TPA: hypothetical protein VGA11_05355 [Acidimicrobiia bacterium]
MRRVVFILGGIIVVLVIVLAVVLVTSKNEDSNHAATTTSVAASTTVATSVPATTAASTTIAPPKTTVPLPPITDDPQTYAQYLLVAWQNNDQGAAGNVASAQAVSQMFAQPYQPIQTTNGPKNPWTLASCDPAAGSLYCTWNGQGSAKIIMTVRTLTGGLPIQVVMVQRQGG